MKLSDVHRKFTKFGVTIWGIFTPYIIVGIDHIYEYLQNLQNYGVTKYFSQTL